MGQDSTSPWSGYFISAQHKLQLTVVTMLGGLLVSPPGQPQGPTPRTASVGGGRSAPSLAVLAEVLAMHTWGRYMLCRAPTCHYLSCHHVAWRYTWSSRQLGICPSPLLQAKPFPPAIAFLPPNMAFTFLLKLASPRDSRSGYLNTSCSVGLAFLSRRQLQHVQHFLF